MHIFMQQVNSKDVARVGLLPLLAAIHWISFPAQGPRNDDFRGDFVGDDYGNRRNRDQMGVQRGTSVIRDFSLSDSCCEKPAPL